MMNDGDARRRLLQSTDFWQIWNSNDVEDRGSKGQKRSSGADKTSKGAMKSYSVCWDQATENCGQVCKVGKIGVRSQGHQELSGESDENNPLKPNQSAPSIYIMIEICYFSLDQ